MKNKKTNMWHVLIVCACVGQTNAAKAGDAEMMETIERINEEKVKEKNSGGLIDAIANFEKNEKSNNKNNATRNAVRLEDSAVRLEEGDSEDFKEAIAAGEDAAEMKEAGKTEQEEEMGKMEQGGGAIEAEKGDKIGGSEATEAKAFETTQQKLVDFLKKGKISDELRETLGRRLNELVESKTPGGNMIESVVKKLIRLAIDGKIDKEVLETFNAQLGEALGEETTRGGQRGVGTQKSGPEKEGMPKGDLDNEQKEDVESEEKDSIVGMEKDEEMNTDEAKEEVTKEKKEEETKEVLFNPQEMEEEINTEENNSWQDEDGNQKSVNRRKVKVKKEKKHQRKDKRSRK